MEGSFANNTCTTTSTLATFAFDRLKNLADLHYMGNEADVGLSWQTNGDLLSLAHNYVSGTDVSFADTYNPAHQVYTSTISASGYKYGPSCAATCTDSYATANALNQYPSITPYGGSAQAQQYDSNGNLHTDASFTYAYDPENRLVSATGTGVAAAYAYDPLGRRTQKSGTGVAQTFFLGDAGDDPIGDYDASGNLLRRYIPGLSIDRPLAMIDYTNGGTKTFFHTDKTGSVVAMSGTTGRVAEGPYLYDPFGTPSSAGGVPFKFDGMRYDTETGLYYDRARVYSPSAGRFLQTDPIGYADDIDWYGFVDESIAWFKNHATPNGFAYNVVRASLICLGVVLPLAAGPTGDLAFIVGERGSPLTKESFGNMFKNACLKAGIDELKKAAHGLRKLQATIWAERGATEHELMALFGWLTPQMAALYTRKFRRKETSLNADDRLRSGTSRKARRKSADKNTV